MEIIYVLAGLWVVLTVWGKFSGQAEKEKREKEKAAERARPPILCSICKRPNKNQGDAICEIFRPAGPKNIKICDNCLKKYHFCNECHQPFTQVFSIWEKGKFCQSCFEKRYRSFRDTREAARIFYGGYCTNCGKSRNIEVHHKTYVREGREHLNDLMVLCRSCHNIQHSKVHTGQRGGKYVYKKGKKTYVTEQDYAFQPRAGDKRQNRNE